MRALFGSLRSIGSPYTSKCWLNTTKTPLTFLFSTFSIIWLISLWVTLKLTHRSFRPPHWTVGASRKRVCFDTLNFCHQNVREKKNEEISLKMKTAKSLARWIRNKHDFYFQMNQWHQFECSKVLIFLKLCLKMKLYQRFTFNHTIQFNLPYINSWLTFCTIL